MKKLIFVLLAFCLLAGLAACGKPAASGLLSDEEIARYESCYLQEINQAIQKLGLKEVERDKSLRGALSIHTPRKAAGISFQQELLVSTGNVNGLYGVMLAVDSLEEGDAVKALSELYTQAVEKYGDPSTYPGLGNRLSEALESIEKNGLQGERYAETWAVGGMTDFTLEISPRERGAALTASYQVQTIVQGKPLSEEELKERVAANQK